MVIPVVAVRGASVTFGAVKALSNVDLEIHPGEAVGLVGHNGAGKSTIVNVINGGLTPHAGSIAYGDSDASGAQGMAAARGGGVRCVFQELSLCPNLTVAENARLLHPGLSGFGWRKRALQLVQRMLQEIFPNNRVDCTANVGALSISERQMIEIALNFLAVGAPPKLVILDEPTSSLDAALAEQLLAHVRRFVDAGGSILLISHILGEILSTSTRIVVMKDGTVVAARPVAEFSAKTLVEAMGSVVKEKTRGRARLHQADAPLVVDQPASDKEVGLKARKGEVIGLAGLGGHGQTDMLLSLFRTRSGNWLPARPDRIAFVAGDRALNGTLPLWSILRNLSVGNLSALARLFAVNPASEQDLGQEWKMRTAIRTPDMDLPILSLSGGNQQKVLFARALSTPAAIVLMDDPMRGVDIGTKQDVYAIIRAEADAGRTFIWYSTEMDEICLCDRVYVFRDGVIVAELSGSDISEERVLAASFSGEAA